ncbi:insulinase family protein [Clostridium sp. WLY-B-L2]|uniref:Insulinase family protein n=1 Tax=Clostridium aromativorans TaxID=2836848 RepID=A0ABS8N253_9CLOT|nr:pitrilysin family protein [Clostridium aromativorans]MCC9293867.1 insulinase family protein [Clostridium aromativorans]CAB1241452.1 Peptidase M16 [Clostridiaceae bacterium BL-3]
MREYMLDNGIKLLYQYREGILTSLCIGFNAGALEESGQFNFGTAHALEHVISKGTEHRDENQINEEFDNVFGFENAMTNYPYTIYYGTCFSDDLERAVKLYGDVILNPIFPEKGFKEEMDVILQEYRDWKDDAYQRCEDALFGNSFNKRRIRELIVGNEGSIKSITLDEIKRFYSTFYFPENCTVCFCSSLDFKSIISIVDRYFGKWRVKSKICAAKEPVYEKNRAGVFLEKVSGIAGARIQYIFDIHDLSEREYKALYLFNTVFGQGTSSLLFSRIRTEKGIAYDLGSSIKDERGMKLFSIKMSTLPENIDRALGIVNSVINELKNSKEYFSSDKIGKIARSLELKREIKRERSIEYCKEVVEHDLMYERFDDHCNSCDAEQLDEIKCEDIVEVIDKVMKNPSIQILRAP